MIDCQGRISKYFEKIEYLSEYVDDQNVVKNLQKIGETYQIYLKNGRFWGRRISN